MTFQRAVDAASPSSSHFSCAGPVMVRAASYIASGLVSQVLPGELGRAVLPGVEHVHVGEVAVARAGGRAASSGPLGSVRRRSGWCSQ